MAGTERGAEAGAAAGIAIERAGVVGAGVMGSGIAQALAVAGVEVACYDLHAESLARAEDAVVGGRYGLGRAVERGKLSQQEADAARARLTFTDSLERTAAADLVLEAVPEDLALKIGIFRRLDELSPQGTVLASNTSGFSIAALAAATARPELVVGWHWASPPVVMPLAEIVRHERSSEAAIDAVRALARRCAKNPIVVRDQPLVWGFVANRVYRAAIVEAQRVVAEGVASADEVDQLMRDCFNWPVGPLAMVAQAEEGWSE